MSLPFGLHYAYSTPLPKWRSGVIVGNWWVARRQEASAVAAIDAGAEVLEYNLPVHDYPISYGEPEQATFYTGRAPGSTTRPEWAWDPANPSRVTVPAYAGKVMDVRKGSPFLEHLLADYYPSRRVLIDAGKLSGVLLDVTGDGYWGAFSGLTATDKAQMSEGERWFAHELRGVLGERAIIVINNGLAGPWDDIDGILVENHAPSEAPYWRTQAGYVRRTVRRRVCSVNRTAADAEAWAKTGIFDCYGAQNNNYQTAPALPISASITDSPWPAGMGHLQPGTQPPPPPPPPDIDPCRDLRATLAQTVSELTAVRETLGVRTGERDQARAALAEVSADLAAIEGDLRKIKGSSGSSAGKAADRLRAVKGRAAIALKRIEG